MFRLIVALSVLCLISPTIAENDDRIIKGKLVGIRNIANQVSVQIYKSHWCGGSIIHESWILTAAHCFVAFMKQENFINDISVRAGSSYSGYGGVVIGAESLIIHPKYDNYTFEYDVALVKLLKPLIYSVYIKPARLLRYPLTSSGLPCLVSGWGRTNENDTTLSMQLQAAAITYLTKDDCSSDRYDYGDTIKDSMICAVGNGKDSCQGDSGGPLSLYNSLTQIGIVSMGTGCARSGFPGVYSDVTHPLIVEFIDEYVIPSAYEY